MATIPIDMIDDDRAKKARAALERVRKGQTEIGRAAKRTREDWRDYGEQLLGKRKEVNSNKLFGQWVKANKLDVEPAKRQGVRTDATWLAEYWDRVEQFYYTLECITEDHHPTNVRQACRKAGMAWAKAKPKKDGTAKKTKKQTGPKRGGWAEVVNQYFEGKLPGGFTLDTMRSNTKRRSEIEAEFGSEIPKGKTIEFGGDVARRLAEAVQRCADKQDTKKAFDEIVAEKKTLSKTAQEKFDSLWNRAHKVMQAMFAEQVEKQVSALVDQRYAETYKRLEAREKELAARENIVRIRMKTFDQWMTQEEFKLVLSCLHPDRHPADQQVKFNRAFQIFNRLKEHLDQDEKVLRTRSWAA